MEYSMMQPTRRRKKRPNYGIRTVEVCRGKNGFGFTISGQQPCILSSIVSNSPAERAGLRPGDYLIAVCGQNVSKSLHDDVVQLIGNCHGILKLQIAENYYSDSSEEDFIMTIRQRPKYPYKYKNSGHNTHPFMHGSKPQKSVCNSLDGHSFDDRFENMKSSDDNAFSRKSTQSLSSRNYEEENINSVASDSDHIFQCIVGYLGTIEMPRKLTPISRQQVVRGCIKRLRAEKRNYTPVLMTIFPCSLRLKNDAGVTIAVYPGGRVTFCSGNNDQSKKYFGVVTTSVSEEPSNSCHVFVTLNAIHQEHAKVTTQFGIACSNSDSTCAECEYFPCNSDPIVNAVRKYYDAPGNGNDAVDELVPANSPQPSNDSSVTTTSNSDSGIGFRDDSGHQSDRILVVDIQNQRLHIQAAGLPDPQYVDCSAEKSDRSSSNTNPPILQSTSRRKHQAIKFFDTESCDNIYLLNARQACKESVFSNRLSCKSFDDLASPVSSVIAKESSERSERRSSPKAFTSTSEVLPVSQSLENLKSQCELYEDLESSNNFSKKHSLQDLTVYSENIVAQGQPMETIESERRVTSWATSLEKLLNDTVGLHVFAEFLEKEFSVENIYFWVACERYRLTGCVEERRKLAQYIYDRFLSNDATDSVNVDSSGKNLSQQMLQAADVNLLQNAQKQIFSLMKFDCYPRFLKSEVYKTYLMRELADENIVLTPNAINTDLLISVSPTKVKTTKESNEDVEKNNRSSRRRRSLLPWSRSRCKSRDRIDRTASNENIVSSCSGSRTSLASWDLTLPMSLCRVVLPDGSSAVLNVQPDESVHYLIGKLLEKRSMPYNSFQVILTATDKVVDLDENASILAGKEVKIEWRIEFRLDLPDRKSLTVKSKPSHTLGAVLGPVLLKHGYNLQMVTLCLMSENEVLEPSTLVSAVDKQRIQVLTRSTPIPNPQGWNNYYGCNTAKQKQTSSTLDEITNRVFEELLHGKAENYRNPVAENVPSTHSDDWSSEHSSKILGKFLRKESFSQEKYRRSKKYAEEQNNGEKKITNRLPPVIAKWKPAIKLDARLEKDGLFEGLRRCQRGRLEDQRGTEINVELPDFLKDKENTPSNRKKMRKFRKETNVVNIKEDKETKDAEKNTNYDHVNANQVSDVYQTPADFTSSNYKPEDDEEDNIYANDVLNFGCNSTTKTPSVFKEPPPLPPKPKNIAWRFSTNLSYNIHQNSSNPMEPNHKSIYLDRPTSSFV